MAGKQFIRLVSGVLQMIAGVQSSAGAANAGDIPALDANGRIDASMMPVGIGAETAVIVTSEAVAAGNFVNVYNVGGTPTCRKADATTAGKPAHGFVLAGVGSGSNATVYFKGTNNQVTGQTAGEVYLQTTAGAGGATVPSASGNVVQNIGQASSATTIEFQPQLPVTLA